MNRFALLIVSVIGWLLAANAAGQAVRQNPGFRSEAVPRNDDGSGPFVAFGFDVNFFGRFRSGGYVNNNGNITLDGPLSTYTPFGLTGTRREIIAPFFADVDTRNPASNLVLYGRDTVDNRNAFAATYVNVGYFASKADKLNSFQVVLIDRSDTGRGNFDIEFNYDRIAWETGDASGGVNGFGGVSASAGWSNGSGEPGTSFELPGSLVPGSFLDQGPQALTRRRYNSRVFGRYLFRARNGAVQPPLTVLTSGLPNGTVGEVYTAELAAMGGSPPYRWNAVLDPGTSLPGLTLASNGVLSGRPTTAGNFSFTATVTARTEDGDQTVAGRVQFSIHAPVLSVSDSSCLIPEAQAGIPMSHRLTARGGQGPFQWSWPAGSVPGLTLSGDGILSGTPEQAGNFVFTVRVRGQGESQPGERSCRMTVRPAPLTATAGACPEPQATRGVPYESPLGAGGGTGPYRWSLRGQLPPGLALEPLGRVLGIPGVTGAYPFTVELTDSRGQSDARDCWIAVNDPAVVVTSACPLPPAATGAFYNESLRARGGDPPYTWSVTGSLPAGLSLAADGTLSGRPASPGPHSFRLRVRDREGREGAQPCNLVVNLASLSIASCPLPPARLGRSYQHDLRVTGGTEPFLWSAAGPLPQGLSLTSEGILRGVPAEAGDFLFTLRLTDGLNRTATQACRLSIEPDPLQIESACPLPPAVTGAPYRAVLSATGGIAPYRWSAPELPPGLALSTDGVLAGSLQAAGLTHFDISVNDTRNRPVSKNCSLNARLPELPTLRLTGLPTTLAPATGPFPVALELGAPYPLALEGEATLSVQAETGSSEGAIHRPDPAVRFANGQNRLRFLIPAGERRAEFPLASSGTVAGTITLQVTRLTAAGSPAPTLPGSLTARVPASAPTLASACLVPASGGFDVRITGLTTTRSLTGGELTIAGAARRFDVSLVSTEYFLDALSIGTGGAFQMSVPVQFTGTVPDAVTVVIQNSVGSSAPREARRCP